LKIRSLDETKAALRLLLTLYEMRDNPPDRMTILRTLKMKYGVDTTAAYTAIRICEQLGLFETTEKKFGRQPRASIIHHLTKKGMEIAKRIAEINEILEKDIT